MAESEYITVEQARRDLSEKDFYKFQQWLRSKNIQNLTQVGEAKYKHEIFATKDQLRLFLYEEFKGISGSNNLGNLYGQTREHLPRYKFRKGK